MHEEENHIKSFLALASVTLWSLGSSAENPGKERRAEAAKPGVGGEGRAGRGTIEFIGDSAQLFTFVSEI